MNSKPCYQRSLTTFGIFSYERLQRWKTRARKQKCYVHPKFVILISNMRMRKWCLPNSYRIDHYNCTSHPELFFDDFTFNCTSHQKYTEAKKWYLSQQVDVLSLLQTNITDNTTNKEKYCGEDDRDWHQNFLTDTFDDFRDIRPRKITKIMIFL